MARLTGLDAEVRRIITEGGFKVVPGGTPPQSEYADRQVQIGKNSEVALRLKSLGLSYQMIAEYLGVSYSTARNYVIFALERNEFEAVSDYRKLQIEQIELIKRELQDIILNGTVSQKLRAIERLDSVLVREARLLGLDAPVQIQAQVTEMTQADIAAQELINEAKAKEASSLSSDA